MSDDSQIIERLATMIEHRAQQFTQTCPMFVGIAGPPGAGKSTLATHLATHFVNHDIPNGCIPMDGFHLSDALLKDYDRLNWKGAIDTFDALGFLALLKRVKQTDETVYAPEYSRTIGEPIAAMIAIPPHCKIIVVEGNYLFFDKEPWNHIHRMMDVAIFLNIDWDTCRRRLIDRQLQGGSTRHQALNWVDRSDRKNYASVIKFSSTASAEVVESTYPVGS